MDIGTGNTTALGVDLKGDDVDFLGAARFSPAGDQVYYTWAGDLHRYDMENRTSTKLTNAGNIYYLDIMQDGRIAYSTETELWVSEKDAGNAKKVLGIGADIFSFDISYDDKKVLYVKTLDSGYVWSNRVLEVYDLEAQQTHRIPNISVSCGEPARWTPGDQLIIFHVQECGKGWPGGYISITGLDGYPEYLIPPSNENPRHFIVNPCGSKLLFSLDCTTSGNTGETFGGKADFYSMEFAKAVPEFPLATLVGAIALTGVVAALNRVRRRG